MPAPSPAPTAPPRTPLAGALTRDVAWSAHPVGALIVRLLVLTVPILAAVVAAGSVAAALPDPVGAGAVIGWWAAVLGASAVASTVVDNLARRALPLATLMNLTLVFPDRAPSRLRVWRRARLGAELAERIAREDDVAEVAGDVLALITSLDEHDRATRGHSERVRQFVELIAERLDLEESDRERLRWAALLHDVGKLNVHADILRKADVPDDAEWEELRRHPIEGMRLVHAMAGWLGPWALAVGEHHERFDGDGYPFGLVGNEISLAGRIVAVADAFEVMTASRPYRRAIGTVAARAELVAGAGTQFDPVIVRALLEVSLPRVSWVLGPTTFIAQIPVLGWFTRAPRNATTATVGAVLGGLVALGTLGAPPTEPPRDAIAIADPTAPTGAPDEAPADPFGGTPDDGSAVDQRDPEAPRPGNGRAPDRGRAPGPDGDAAPGDPRPRDPGPGDPGSDDPPAPPPDGGGEPPPPPGEPGPSGSGAGAGSRLLVGGNGVDAEVIVVDDSGAFAPDASVTPATDPEAPLVEADSEVDTGSGSVRGGVDEGGPFLDVTPA